MKKALLFLSFILTSTTIFAQKPILSFSQDGNFKIIQFTDVHYKPNKEESKVAIQLIEEVLEAEQPDLVIFTGDVVWDKPAKQALDEVFAPVIKSQTPFAFVFGNHDDESGMSRQEIMDYIETLPYSLSQAGDRSLFGVGNYVLEIKDKKGKKNKALLYCLDSGSYAQLKKVSHYDWFKLDQIQWYTSQSESYTKENGNKPYPALAFFHIPLAEYPIMATAEDANLVGERRENECNGKLNTGMFAAMKQAGDVMGTFVGHDHDNDYIGNYYGIYLAYGRYSGGKTVYNNLGKNGCRIINMKEGKQEFDTYIYLLGGEKIYNVNYPNTFEK